MLRILNEYGYPAGETSGRLIRMRELHLLYEQLAFSSDTSSKTKKAKTERTVKPKPKKVTLADFAKALVAHKNAPLILGLNRFENILWFNRECALETSWTTCMLYVLEAADETGEKDAVSALNAALKIKQKADTAIEKSGYKAENALILLEARR